MTSVIGSELSVPGDAVALLVSLLLPVMVAVIGYAVKKLLAVLDSLTNAITSLERCVAVAVQRIEHLERQQERQHAENLAKIGKP